MPDPVNPPTPPARTAAEIEAELNTLPDPDLMTEGEEKPEVKPVLTPAEAELADFEEQASRKGWVPKDKFTGPADKWVDAKTFVQRGERFTKNLVREVEQLKAQIAQFEGTRKAFVKFHEETIAAKDKELKETIRQLKVQRSAAIREGDDDTSVDLEERIEAVEQQRKEIKALPAETPEGEESADGKPEAKGPDANDPVLKEWIEDGNAWFDKDETLRAYAVEVGNALIKEGTKVRGRPFLDLVAAKMRENFPRKFKQYDAEAAAGNGEPPAGRRGTAEGSDDSSTGAKSGAVNGKTERDLPAEDLKLMRQFIKEGWMTKEKFLASYFSR